MGRGRGVRWHSEEFSVLSRVENVSIMIQELFLYHLLMCGTVTNLAVQPLL